MGGSKRSNMFREVDLIMLDTNEVQDINIQVYYNIISCICFI